MDEYPALTLDHVTLLAPDADHAAAQLGRDGIGLVRGPYHPFSGARNHSAALQFPQYLEVLTIEDRATAQSTVDGRRLLQCEQGGYGALGWTVLVDDLEAVSERVGVPIHDWTIPHGDGTLRGWRTVGTNADLPFFIDYPNNGNRAERYQLLYEQTGHTSSPTHFVDVVVGRDPDLAEWLGAHHLPLRITDGPPGLHSVTIATSRGPVTYL